MSSTIWTRCAPKFKFSVFDLSPWRIVEHQYQTSTRKLVASAAEQEILEDVLERSKSPLNPADKKRHYLLFTPFRYRPFRHGSRFGLAHERFWYGSDAAATAFAEYAYLKFRFLSDTSAELEFDFSVTAFQAELTTSKAADLTQVPFDEFTAQISDKTTYAESQPLGSALRSVGVEAFRYRSARDPFGGTNIAVATPIVLKGIRPSMEQWRGYASASRALVEFSRDSLLQTDRYAFPRSVFEVKDKFPTP